MRDLGSICSSHSSFLEPYSTAQRGLVKPFKETVKCMLEDFVNADTEGRDAFMNRFAEIHDILGEEEQE